MSGHPPARPLRGAGLVSLAALMAALPAQAQTTADPTAASAAAPPVIVLEAITVTGEKVARDLRSTASSVEVIDSKTIAESPARPDVATLIADTPNVIYSENVSAPVIRGQDGQGPHTGANAFFAGTVPRATISVDGHYLNYNEMYFGATSVWDVDNVEVFRGPQTVSQGANAIAGAVIVNTKDPTFTREGAYRVEAGDYGQRRASLAFSGPLSEQLAARVALDYNARDTFIDYVNPNFQQNEIGQDFESKTGRLKLLWMPAAVEGLDVELTLSHADSTRPSQEAAAEPYEDLKGLHATMPGWEQKTNTAILGVNYALTDDLRLFSQFQASRSDVDRRIGVTHFGDADVTQNNVSNETRLNFGYAEDAFSGMAGVYVEHSNQDEFLDQTFRYAHVDSFSTRFRDEKTHLGLFGEGSLRFGEQWTLTGGLRYQQDRVHREGFTTFSPTEIDYSDTFSQFLPRLTLAYEATPGLTVGGLVSRGYNPGGISLNFSTGEWHEFKDEKIWNYELFARASLLDDRLTLNGNLFYMDYRDGQFFIPVPVGDVYYSYTINADKARSYGLEASAVWRPLESLTLRAGAGLLKTKFDEVSRNPAYAGKEFPKSPSYTLSFGADWDATDRLTLSAKASYVDGYFSNVANTPEHEVDGRARVDLQASYALKDGLEVYAFVNNVFDERKPMSLENARGTTVFRGGSMTAPRMLGVGLRGEF